MAYCYAVYDLVLRTPFACPALPPADAGAVPDVEVVEGPVPRHLEVSALAEGNWEAAPGSFLLRGGPRSGRFLVESGKPVVLERNPHAEESMLAFHFVDAVLAAVLRQKGNLVLHANAALGTAGAVALSGLSGAGKSTTMAGLLARGWSMLSDDVTALRFSASGQPEVLPGVLQLRLCEDAALQFSHDSTGLPRLFRGRPKATVTIKPVRPAAPGSLQAIFILGMWEGGTVRSRRLEGTETFAALQDCVYGPMLPEEHPALFSLFAAVAAQVPVYLLERPTAGWSLDAVLDTVEAVVAGPAARKATDVK